MREGSFWRSLFKEGIVNALFEGLKYAIVVWLPVLGATVTLISGKFYPEVPLPYLFAAAAVVFAGLGIGLLRFGEWRAKRSPANKLTLSIPRVVFDYVRDATTGEVTGIEYAQIGIGLSNVATFGVSYVVDEVFSSVDGHNNQDAKLILNSVVPPSHVQIYRQDPIDMRGSLLKPRIEARLKFKSRYGRAGREKYTAERNAIITCVFDKNTGYENQVPQDVTQ